MGTILNGKYLSMPEQVQKNKNDIQIINEYLENIYKCSTALEESSTSINIEYTNIGDKRDFLFAFLLDNKGLLFKIIDIVGGIVYLEFYSKLPSVDFNYLGEWVAGNNEYHPNDVVLYNGSLYICENVVLDSSVAPPQDTTNWSLFLGFGDDIGLFITNLYNNRNEIVTKDYLKGTLLWENANPGSSEGFAEQDVITNENLFKFERIIISYREYYNGLQKEAIFEHRYGGASDIVGANSTAQYPKVRSFTIPGNTTIHFRDCLINNAVVNNSLIPYRIYGIRRK